MSHEISLVRALTVFWIRISSAACAIVLIGDHAKSSAVLEESLLSDSGATMCGELRPN